MKRVVGIGNLLVREDRVGLLVAERLRAGPLPPGVEVVDGGLRGLDLLPLVEGADAVVFVDALLREPGAPEVQLLSREEAAACDGAAWGAGAFDHAAGLPYLLRLLPRVIEGPLPRVEVVGVDPDADEEALASAAALCLARLADEPACAGGAP